MMADLDKSSSIVGDQSVFSTYASGLEVMVDQFQPSGIDYIIHALGDDVRESYLNSFENSDCKYATTVKEEYSTWEYWIRSANWFFYRELYQKYHPIASNSYQIIWEKNDSAATQAPGLKTKIEIVQIDDAKVKVSLVTDEAVNGVADVRVTYASTKHTNWRSRFIFQNMVLVTSAVSQWNIRAEGDEFLPIEIVNGTGEIILTSQPELDTSITVLDVECLSIYTVPFDYIEIQEGAFLDNGTCKVDIAKTEKNRRILEDAISIKAGGKEVPINAITETDSCFRLELAYSDIGGFNRIMDKNNVCRVLRNGENGEFRSSGLTDSNWTNGISNDGSTILFNFSSRLLKVLTQNDTIKCGGESREIVGINYNEYWIYVRTKEANLFQTSNIYAFE